MIEQKFYKLNKFFFFFFFNSCEKFDIVTFVYFLVRKGNKT